MTFKVVRNSLLVLIIAVIITEFYNSKKPKHPFAGLSMEELVRKYGYSLETHTVTTRDGYLLTLHRIRCNHDNTSKVPVLFMHGFTQSSIDFVILGPEKSLSFLLADKKYDVWLGNVRGTTLSRRHIKLNPDTDKTFWNFSLHEIGIYDTSAFIDYILSSTGEKSLHYVGYSQGTTVFFILTSENPSYASKVRLMTALGPAILLKEPISPFSLILLELRISILALPEWFHMYEILSNNGMIAKYMRFICNENSLFVNLCLHHIFMIQGYSYEETNKSMLSLIYSNMPAGASPMQMVHILQLMHSGNFEQFDLGYEGNLNRYGQELPPLYNLSNVGTPVALYYASNDWTINIKNIDKVANLLPSVVKKYEVPSSSFNHNDFIYANNVVSLLYDSVLQKIDEF